MLRVVRSFEDDEGPKLYICSTPIGNLNDVTPRLMDTLKSVDVVAAEDTRQTRKLLSRYDIHVGELASYHEHNAVTRRDWLLDLWRQGKRVALVSDAGTPIVSDPGDDAVQLAVENGVPVIPIPGPSAVLTALVGSGLPALPFTFVGFLPRDTKEARHALVQFGRLPWTFVFYEAPHRLRKTMDLAASIWPDRQMVLAKELTKRHETFLFGTAAELAAFLLGDPPRGEYVVVVGPDKSLDGTMSGLDLFPDERTVMSLEEAVLEVQRLMTEGISHKEAVKRISGEQGIRRKDLYDATL